MAPCEAAGGGEGTWTEPAPSLEFFNAREIFVHHTFQAPPAM